MEVDFFDAVSFTEKQQKAWSLISNHKHILLYGGSRSGKTYDFLSAVVFRALAAPKSDHLILRKTYKDCRQKIFQKSLKQLLDVVLGGKYYKENKSDSVVTLDNGSQIICDGLDDVRIESVLGGEYATIFFNEISEISYEVIETVLTRLAQVVKTIEGKVLTKKAFYDENPTKKNHWSYHIFLKGVNPADKTPLKYIEDYACMQMNPIDNIDHLGSEYIEKTLGQLSRAKKIRFQHGEFGDDTEGALWCQKWIDDNRAEWDKKNRRYNLPDLDRVVVAIDPSVTANITSDETGIVVVGSKTIDKTRQYWVLSDESAIYPVRKWAEVALSLYDKYKAGKIIGEVNNGGDLVEANIKAVRPQFHGFNSVRATRGKAIRAEPVATLYDKGLIHHVGIFSELEDELTSWTPDDDKSPNRLDALVWGITELMGGPQGEMSVSEYRMPGV